jgi:hypothetical protein
MDIVISDEFLTGLDDLNAEIKDSALKKIELITDPVSMMRKQPYRSKATAPSCTSA